MICNLHTFLQNTVNLPLTVWWPIRQQHERIWCEISGFFRGVDEIFALLSCYAAYVNSCLTTFWDNLSVCSFVEDEADRLFQNVVKQILTNSAKPRKPKKSSYRTLSAFTCWRSLEFVAGSSEEWRAVRIFVYPEAVVTMTPFHWPCWGPGQVNGSPDSQMQSSGYLLQSRCCCCWWRSRTEQCLSAGSRSPTSSSGQEAPH